MKSNITFKRVYEYGGDCKASDLDYICGYQASNGVMVKKKFTEGLSAIYCWMVGEDYYDTLNAAKNAVIRKANEAETSEDTDNEPEAAADSEPQVFERKPAFEVGGVYRNEAQEAGKDTIKVTVRNGYAVTFVWNRQEMTAGVQLDDPDSEYVLIGLKPFFASELETDEESAENERLAAKAATPVSQTEPETAKAAPNDKPQKATINDEQTVVRKIEAVISRHGTGMSHKALASKVYRELTADGIKAVILNDRYIMADGVKYQFVKRAGAWVVKAFAEPKTLEANEANEPQGAEAERGEPAMEAAMEAAPQETETTDEQSEARNVFAYVYEAIKAASGDAGKLEALRVMVDSVARNERLSPELRHIEIYLACVFRHDEDVLEAFDLYYNRGAEETAQHFGWTDFLPVRGMEQAAGQPAPQEAETTENAAETMTAEKSRKVKPPKQYTIRVTRDRTGRAHDHTGTLEELIQTFSYTLEKGKSWEWGRGRHKINLAPKTARSLVTNLQNASDNATVNGYSGVTYELVTV